MSLPACSPYLLSSRFITQLGFCFSCCSGTYAALEYTLTWKHHWNHLGFLLSTLTHKICAVNTLYLPDVGKMSACLLSVDKRKSYRIINGIDFKMLKSMKKKFWSDWKWGEGCITNWKNKEKLLDSKLELSSMVWVVWSGWLINSYQEGETYTILKLFLRWPWFFPSNMCLKCAMKFETWELQILICKLKRIILQ